MLVQLLIYLTRERGAVYTESRFVTKNGQNRGNWQAREYGKGVSWLRSKPCPAFLCEPQIAEAPVKLSWLSVK
jgi:hypothetical protein